MPWTTTTTRASGFTVTAAVWNAELVDNMTFLKEPNLTTYTADVTISATTVGTANQIVSSGAITYEAVPHMVEFWSPRFTSGDGALHIIVRDGTTVLGTLFDGVAATSYQGIYVAFPVTPTAASHTYNVAGWRAGTTNWTVRAGTGGTTGDSTTFTNGFIRVTRRPT